jgi:hypothetical protein
MIKSYNGSFKKIEELEKFLDKKQTEIKENHQLLIQVFTGIISKKIILDIQNSIKLYFPKAILIGATTDGEIVDGETYEKTIAISLTTFENSILYSGGFENRDHFYTGQRIAKKLAKDSTKVVIILSDGIFTNGEELLKGFASINRSVIIAGGMAGDNGELKETFVFNNNEIFSKGAVAVGIVNEHLKVFNQYNFGWLPFGEKLKVTNAQENIVYSIDNIRPVKIYEKYLGLEIALKLPTIGIEFPLIKIDNHGVNVARAVLGKSDEGTLQFAGNLSNGETVQIGVGDLDTILNQSKDNLLKYINKSVETTFIYSCMARRRFLYNSVNLEVRPFNSISRNVGFFTDGEFFSSQDSNGDMVYHLMNQTLTTISIAEENISFVKKDVIYREIANFQNHTSHTTKAISYLTNAVLKDIEKAVKDKENIAKQFEVDIGKEIAKNHEKDELIFNQYKLAQIGNLMGMMAHQWRQPLSNILAITSTCKLQIALDKFDINTDDGKNDFFNMLNNNISKIEQSVDFLSKTIDNFRKFYKEDIGLESIFLIELLEHSLTLINEPNIKFNFHCNENIKLKVYSNQVIQVILNIIKNSVEAIKDLKISNGKIIFECSKDEKFIYLDISDNGGGIPENNLAYIFDKDFTTKKDKGGSGLGLYMSKLIIETKCTGYIKAFNIENGVKFRIILPIL